MRGKSPSIADVLEVDPRCPLTRFTAEHFVTANLKGLTPRAVIGELIGLLAEAALLPDKNKALDAAMQREEVLPTAVGSGFAFPHVRGIGDGGVASAIGLSHEGVVWGGERVHVVVFTTLPKQPIPAYLRFMMAFAKAFSARKKLDALLSCENDADFWMRLCKSTRSVLRVNKGKA